MEKIFKNSIDIAISKEDSYLSFLTEDSAFSGKDSYLELVFNVVDRAGILARYADGYHIRMINLGPIALFRKHRLTSSSGEEIEEIDKARVICLMHKLKSSSRDSDD